MNYSTLTQATEDRSTIVTLNRPERRNVLDEAMIQELTDVFTQTNRDTRTRVVILTGAGSSFCAGMDLEYLRKSSQMGQQENVEDARNLLKLYQLIRGLKKPVVAMVNGPALGGGCGLAAACDFVFASKGKARLGVPEVKLGFLPAVILFFLIKRMGEGRTRELVLRGEILDAAAAREQGLVTEVVEDDRLEPRVREFACSLARSTSAASVTLTKDLFSRFDEMNMKDALEYAANLNALVRKTGDFQKGIDSFLNKEKLEW